MDKIYVFYVKGHKGDLHHIVMVHFERVGMDFGYGDQHWKLLQLFKIEWMILRL